MAKIITTIKIEEEHLSTIKELDINLSEWVRERLEEELISPKEIKVKIKNCELRLKKWQKIGEKVLQGNTDIFKGTTEEKEFLKNTAKIIKKNPHFLSGQINLYHNKFTLVHGTKPTKTQFLKLLDKIK